MYRKIKFKLKSNLHKNLKANKSWKSVLINQHWKLFAVDLINLNCMFANYRLVEIAFKFLLAATFSRMSDLGSSFLFQYDSMYRLR